MESTKAIQNALSDELSMRFPFQVVYDPDELVCVGLIRENHSIHVKLNDLKYLEVSYCNSGSHLVFSWAIQKVRLVDWGLPLF